MSTLHSPVQLHRESSVQEQDMPANVEHIGNGNETQPSLSSFRAPSNLNSIQEGKHGSFTSLRHATHWKTVGMMIGFLFAGQSAHAQGRMLLTVHSPSFRLRALPFVPEFGRQAYRHKLSYATPDLRNLHPFDHCVQRRTNSMCWTLLRAATVVRSSRERNDTKHNRETLYTSY